MTRLTPWLLGRRWRIVSAGVLMVALPLLALAFTVSLYVGRVLEERLLQESRSLATLAAHTLEERLNSVLNMAALFKKRILLQDAIRRGDVAGIRYHLKQIVETGGQIERSFIATPKGVLYVDYPEDPAVQGVDFSSKDWYRGVSKSWQPYVSEFYQRQAAPQRYLFAIAVPVTDNQSGEVLAILVVQPSKAFVAGAMQTVNIPDGQIYVVDKKGVLIYHSSLDSDRKVDYSHTPAVKALQQGGEGVVRTMGTFRKVPIVATYSPVRNAGWGVVIDRYEDDVLEPAVKLTNWIGGFTLFFLGIGAILASKGARLLAATDTLAKKLRDEEESRRQYGEFLSLLNAPYESVEELCRAALAQLAAICDLSALACHLAEGETLRPRTALAASLPGETGPFARECAREKLTRRLREIPPGSHLRVATAVGNLAPREIVAVPLLYKGEAIGVIEAASLQGLSGQQLDLLERLAIQLAIAVTTLQGHLAQKSLAEEVQHANRELRSINEEQQAMNEEFRQMNAELETQQKALQEANLRIEEASRAKSDFLANMSHELRTPLNSIIGFADILDQGLQGELTQEQAQSVRDIRESGRHLLSLINDILDLSKVEAGKMELELEQVVLEDLVQDALTLFREKALKHRLTLTAEIGAATGVIVADARKVKQVIINLLGNAVKFTADGGSIRVRTRRIAAPGPVATDKGAPGGAFVEVAVADTGIGISPEDQKKLFQPFQQIQTTLTKEFTGTGLGLNLCRNLVKLHGGTIRVESEPGRGSTFTFTLPVEQPVKRQAPFRPAAAAIPVALIKNVVVIEDDAVTVRTIEAALRNVVCTVHTAPDGERGLALVRKERPDLVVLDLGLPGMSGLEVAQALKADPGCAAIPIVVLTAMDLAAAERSRLSLLAEVILQKGDLSGAQFLATLLEAGGKSA